MAVRFLTNEDGLSLEAQTLTEAQQAQARENIGAVSSEGVGEAVGQALAEAKESGEFDGPPGGPGPVGPKGEDGYSPVKGVDYWTEEDQAEILEDLTAKTTVKMGAKAYYDGYKVTTTVNGVTAESPAMSLVRYDANQTGLTDAQKQQAQANIGAAPGIINTASGDTIALTDSLKRPLSGLKIFGKTTQDGTPSPDAPVPMVSAGDGGNITVSIGTSEEDSEPQTLLISTPDGLPGIPVTSGGNYTDAAGQRWICDEIDLARGVRVRRIGTAECGKLTFYVTGTNSFGNTYCSFGLTNILNTSQMRCSGYRASRDGGDCTIYPLVSSIVIVDNRFVDKDTASSIVKAENFVIIYEMAAPVEEPLTEEEIAAYAALYTNDPSTTILNDGGAGMEVRYSADTKRYIDNKFAQLAAAIVSG